MLGSEGHNWPRRSPRSSPWRPGSILRLQQLLAELGYLPLTFTPTSPLTSPTEEGDQVGSSPGAGRTSPALLTLWTPGTDNVITRGAVMDFEEQNGLKTDGVAGTQVWTDLLSAVQAGKADPRPTTTST